MATSFSFTADAAEQALLHVQGWQELDAGDVSVETVSGGLTNVLTKVEVSEAARAKVGNDAPTAVLVRHFGKGTGELVDREREGAIFAHFGSIGLSPALLGTFKGGRIEAFFNAKTLASIDCHDVDVAAKIGAHLARVHAADVPIPHENGLPDNLFLWWKLAARSIMPDVEATRKAMQFDMPRLHTEVASLIDLLASLNAPVTFTHMDLLAANILQLREPGREGEVTFVDFEYGMYAWRGFDFGNHFAEASINYSVDGHPGFVLNPDNYPSEETQTAFFTAYLAETGVTDPAAVAAAIPDLMHEARICSLASHMLWGLWAIVRAANPSDEFGFLEFAAARLGQYFALRKKWGV
ncbi:choline/ethanolamine kinase [Thecamonas trahens ATCC 50062]|uniref:ethanolamine kinase n=1 Tax=Thecamonas trahens ATCC 50062 TaxID=461836 RepID=A0A0L0D989_THETB|nr:choline/ethanolamine kinase [Thecamonas trahens ATCC 50062]KNC48909.1 choline/ethanolamine kinase [Thecamonas trahens ATCC 50062]|eukprot:XP_013758326.1 choline/ethanolamine kinase [Thecamonas trahens ATCC 50062]